MFAIGIVPETHGFIDGHTGKIWLTRNILAKVFSASSIHPRCPSAVETDI